MSDDVPGDLKFLASHEWIRLESDGIGVVGITEHAQQALGDLVYVELPELKGEVSAGDQVAVVESVKAASDIYTPVSGVVVAVNESLEDSPELINSDAYGDGWIYRIQLSNLDELDDLLSPAKYEDQIEAEDEDDLP